MRRFGAVLFLLSVFCGTVFASELDDLRKHMTSRFDEIEGIKWIRDKAIPERIGQGTIYAYLGQKENTLWMRLVMGFRKESWVFFERIIFNIDGNKRTLDVNFYEVNRDNGGGEIWEYVDLSGDDYNNRTIIDSIISSDKTLIRFAGKQYVYDFKVSKKQKDALQRVVTLYTLMK